MKYEKDLQTLKEKNKHLISTMEKATSVTIVESDYWKALINLNRNQNQQLSIISENQVNEDTINHYSTQTILQLKKKMTEQENTIRDQLKNQEIILKKQAGKMNESMLSTENQTHYHRKRIKLSQKEIEKRLAHGQKSDGYEEYEDYYNNEISM